MELKRSVSLGEVIGFSITVLICVSGIWYNIEKRQSQTDTRISLLEMQLQNDKDFKAEVKESFKALQSGQKSLEDGQSEIKIILQNKQDRK